MGNSLLMLAVIVSVVRSSTISYPFPESYTSKCKNLTLLGDEVFSQFIETKLFVNTQIQNLLGQSLNTIVCYKGDATLQLVVSEKPTPPVNGERFVLLRKCFQF